MLSQRRYGIVVSCAVAAHGELTRKVKVKVKVGPACAGVKRWCSFAEVEVEEYDGKTSR